MRLKTVAVFLCLIICSVIFVSCHKEKREETYTVGVGIFQYDNDFMTLYRKEIENYFKSLETDTVKYKIRMFDGKNDMSEQSNQVDTMIAQCSDVIILNLVQTSSAEVLIDRINAVGTPCILINKEPPPETFADYDGVCYVGADAKQSGTIQGNIVLSLEDNGDINGDGVVSYIMIEGDPENSDSMYRTKYSIKAITDAGIKVECLDSQVGNWSESKGQEICANALAKYGDRIEVVFCNNDAMAIGAFSAIQAAGKTVGKDIYLLGVDGLEECVEMVNKGTMTGTVLNDYVGQAHTAVDAAIRAINNEKLEKYYWVDYLMIK